MKHDVAWVPLQVAFTLNARDTSRALDMPVRRTDKPVIHNLAILSAVDDTGRVEQEAS